MRVQRARMNDLMQEVVDTMTVIRHGPSWRFMMDGVTSVQTSFELPARGADLSLEDEAHPATSFVPAERPGGTESPESRADLGAVAEGVV